MKQAVFVSTRDVRVREIDTPEVFDEEILIKVKAVGICSAEQRLYLEENQGIFPCSGGHECTGVIEKIGSRVSKEYKKGQNVVFCVYPRCGICHFCRNGDEASCENKKSRLLKDLKRGTGSGLAEYFVARPEFQIVILDEHISFEEGTMIQPLACVIKSVNKAKILFGDLVIVTGAGIMSLLHALLVKLQGGEPIVLEVNEKRIKKAIELGLEAYTPEKGIELINRKSKKLGADAAFFIGGSKNGFKTCIENVRKSGKIGIYGDIYPQPSFPLDITSIRDSDKTLSFSHSHNIRDLTTAARLGSSRIIDLRPFLTTSFDLEHIHDALETSFNPEHYRVIVKM